MPITFPRALALFALLSLVGCERQPPVRDERPRPVRSMVVEPSRSTTLLDLPGEVRPRVETRYGFRLGGKIAERLVSVGDTVSRGQVLARLDPQDVAPAIAAARAQLEAAQTDLKLARIELQRLIDLRDRNFVSAAQVDRQQAQADSAQSRMLSAQAQLNQALNSSAFQSLIADAPGVVTAVDAEAGQVVAAGQSVIRVARTGEKELLVNLPEAELPLARSARGWRVNIPAAGVSGLPADLRELSPIADPASRTYPMRLALRGDSSRVALGMSATVQAMIEGQAGFVLPMSALHSRGPTPMVWVIRDDLSVTAVAVQTTGMLDDAVVAVSGVKAGDRVVTAGASLLIEGQRVRLLDERQAPLPAPGTGATPREAGR
jgi:membrane fusion protein, multidrug efflux system